MQQASSLLCGWASMSFAIFRILSLYPRGGVLTKYYTHMHHRGLAYLGFGAECLHFSAVLIWLEHHLVGYSSIYLGVFEESCNI